MTPPIRIINSLTDLTDDELDTEIRRAQAAIASGAHDPHHGYPTREEGLRRLTRVRDGIAGMVAEAEANIVYELSRAEGNVSADILTRWASLHALAENDAAWDALAARLAAPTPSHIGDTWRPGTDAEAATEKAERATCASAGRIRLDVLEDEKNRRNRQHAKDRDAAEIERYRAKAGR